MARNPVVLIHGYSVSGNSFKNWVNILSKHNYQVIPLHVCNYRTLTNEVTVKDLAEGFDRALRIQNGLEDNQEFDAIVHSTGMLVLRSWLTTYEGRRNRLKRLIGLAPATFGSPLAHKGRSWLGAIFKGNKQWGPDFLEAGDRVLDALELGSPFTWDLAHKDLIGPDDQQIYGENNNTPYVFVFCGTQAYTGITSLVNEPGTDGTVRWAGCPLNTRKITIDLTQDRQRDSDKRIIIEPWRKNIDIPLVPIQGCNHQTIMSDPTEELVDLVISALGVSSQEDWNQWNAQAQPLIAVQNELIKQQKAWQQFIVHAVDERFDPISDFYIQLFTKHKDGQSSTFREREVNINVHTYRKDPSYRCFHLNLSELDLNEHKQVQLDNLYMRVIASSGSECVGYYGYGSEKITNDAQTINLSQTWDAQLDISPLLSDLDIKLFYPFTTTLIELKLNREPLPLNRTNPNEVCWFLDNKPSKF